MLVIITGPVADAVHKFMRDRHTGRYLEGTNRHLNEFAVTLSNRGGFEYYLMPKDRALVDPEGGGSSTCVLGLPTSHSFLVSGDISVVINYNHNS